MMKGKYLYCSFLLLVSILIFSTTSHAQSRLRQVRFEELDSLQAVVRKPVLVFIHTDWCMYCGAMRNVTLKKNSVIRLLNEQFYFVNFDAEQKSDIMFKGSRYAYKPTGMNTGVHELAIELGRGKDGLGFPTVSILSETGDIVLQYAGYITAKELVQLLNKVLDSKPTYMIGSSAFK